MQGLQFGICQKFPNTQFQTIYQHVRDQWGGLQVDNGGKKSQEQLAVVVIHLG